MVNTILIIAISIFVISIIVLTVYFIDKKTLKYSCDTKGNCIRNDNGNYTSSNCNNKCSISTTTPTINPTMSPTMSPTTSPITKYSCNMDKCSPDPNGMYTTSNCDNECTNLQPLPTDIGYIVLERLPALHLVKGCSEVANKCENLNEKMNAWINGQVYLITSKIHGTSSGGWEQKSYNMKFALKTAPYPKYFNKAKAYILYAPYFEFNKLQDPLIYYLSNSIGMTAPNFYPVHLWINKDGPPNDWNSLTKSKLPEQICIDNNNPIVVQGGDSPYRGLYWVLNKINEDMLNLSDNDFLLEFDRGLCTSDFTSLVKNYKPFNVDVTNTAPSTGYSRPIMEFPNADSKPDRLLVLGNILTNFAEALFNDKETEPSQDVLNMIDIESWVKYFILSEVASSVDGYMYSTYLNVRYNEVTKTYKIYMGPVWDYNEALSSCMSYYACRDGGNANFWRYAKQWWYFSPDKVKYGIPQYYARILMSSTFRNTLFNTYQNLRKNQLSENYINLIIDNLSGLLSDGEDSSIINHTFHRWPKRFEYFIPKDKNDSYMENYRDQLFGLKDWISKRLDWLDKNMTDGPPLNDKGNNGYMFEFGKNLPAGQNYTYNGACTVNKTNIIQGCDVQTKIGLFYAKYPCDSKKYN